MQLPCQLINHSIRTGKKDGRDWTMNMAQVIVSTTDRDGITSKQAVEIRMPDTQRAILPEGVYLLEVEPYKAKEGGLAFAVRSVKPPGK